MFKSKVDKKVKRVILKKLQINPQNNYISVRKIFLESLLKNNKKKIHEVVRVIKSIIKDKIPAKPKYYSLMLLKDLMETQNKILISYFEKKLSERLFKIAKVGLEKGKGICL